MQIKMLEKKANTIKNLIYQIAEEINKDNYKYIYKCPMCYDLGKEVNCPLCGGKRILEYYKENKALDKYLLKKIKKTDEDLITIEEIKG